MLLSEFIEQLQKIKDEIGDKKIYVEEPAQGSPNMAEPRAVVIPYQYQGETWSHYVVIQ